MTYGSIALRPAHGAHLCLLKSEIHLMTIDGATYDHRMEQPAPVSCRRDTQHMRLVMLCANTGLYACQIDIFTTGSQICTF